MEATATDTTVTETNMAESTGSGETILADDSQQGDIGYTENSGTYSPEADDLGKTETPWYDGMIGEEFLSDKIKGFKSAEDLAKAYLNAEKMIGQKVNGEFKFPGEDATPDEVASFHRRLGVPESPDDYEIPDVAVVEGFQPDTNAISQFRGLAKEAHLTPSQFEAIMGGYLKMTNEQATAQQAYHKQELEHTEKWMRKEFGRDFDDTLRQVQKVAHTTGLGMRLAEAGLGNSYEAVTLMLKIGELLPETGGRDVHTTTTESLSSELKSIVQRMSNSATPVVERDMLDKRRMQIYRTLYPEK